MKLSDEMRFFLLLIESYAEARGRMTGDVMREWDENGITQRIYDSYDIYHCEALENAFMDIDSLIATGKHAY